MARHLRELGAVKGDRIAAYGKNSDLFALLYLACARAGLIHVPVNFQLKGDELDYILGNSGAEVVFADDDLIDAVTATDNGAAAQVRAFTDLLTPASRRTSHRSEMANSTCTTTMSSSCCTPRGRPRRRRAR